MKNVNVGLEYEKALDDGTYSDLDYTWLIQGLKWQEILWRLFTTNKSLKRNLKDENLYQIETTHQNRFNKTI